MRAVVAALAALAILAPAAHAATLRGTVRGLPPAAKRAFAAVEAVDPNTGRIAAAQLLEKGSRYRLAVPAGRYLVGVEASDRRGRRVRVISRLVRAGGRGPTLLARAAAAAPAGVVGIGDIDVVQTPSVLPDAIVIPGVRLAAPHARGLVTTKMVNALKLHGNAVVETSGRMVAAAKREERLTNSDRSQGPGTHYDPLKPRFQVTGGGTVDRNGALRLVLKLTDLKTGESFTKAAAGEILGWDALSDRLATDFAKGSAAFIDESLRPGASCGVSVDLTGSQLRLGSRDLGYGAGAVVAPDGDTVAMGRVRADHGDLGPFRCGETVVLQAKAFSGSRFAGWGGACQLSGTSCSVRVGPHTAVTATFRVQIWTARVVNAQPRFGHVDGQGITCGDDEETHLTTCEAQVREQTPDGEIYHLNAFANQYRTHRPTFASFDGCTSYRKISAARADCSLAVKGDATVTVTWNPG